MLKTEDYKQIEISSITELRAWLEKHHQQTESVWLVTYKKSVPEKYVARGDIIDQLLCFGWVDGILRALNEDRTMHFVSPRQTQYWTRMYKDRFARLAAAGLVHDAGYEQVALSKENGLWDFMDDVDDLVIHEDLGAALQNAQAQHKFADLNDSYKRNVLRFIKLAKTDATRAKRIAKIVDYTRREERIKNM